MKKNYANPELKIWQFADSEDIVTLSTFSVTDEKAAPDVDVGWDE